MKRLTVVLLLIPAILFSETSFSGEGKLRAIANIPEDDYESLINPGNIYEIKDLSFLPTLILGIDSYDSKSNFEVKFGIASYPIGDYILFGSSEEEFPLISQMLSITGDSINTFELYRLYLDVDPVDSLSISIGRKPYLMGFGYGWNPTDLINPLKDPEDPNCELKGLDSISSTIDMDLATIRAILASDKDYEDLYIASDISLYFDGLDILISGLYNFSESRSEVVNSIAIGFTKDILGVAFYGEGVVRDGSRNLYPGVVNPGYKEEVTYSILGGFEYTFTTDTTLIGEYYYNGEGYNREEREEYKSYLEITGGAVPLHNSSNYSRHYTLLFISQPIWEFNTTISGTFIYAPDSYSLTLAPEIVYDLSGNTNISIGYSGLFSLGEDILNEEELSPVKNSFAITFSTIF